MQVTDVQTDGLVYADIGRATFNQQEHLLAGIPDLDDTRTEYAKINHDASVKPLKSHNVVKNNGKLEVYAAGTCTCGIK